MNKLLSIIGIALCLLGCSGKINPFYRVNITSSWGGLCLDGSQGAYYLSMFQGSEQEDKFILYFEGGGWCGSSSGNLQDTIEDCYQRSKTPLGSSLTYPAQIADFDGILSGDPAKNPFYYNWNRVVLKYCDGTGHQGYAEKPISYKGSDLYFRGANNTNGAIQELILYYIIRDSSDLIITGSSAGGLATYYWANYIKSQIKPEANIVAAPDSGFFLDYVNAASNQSDYRQLFINFMQLSNVEIDPIVSECVADFPNDKWKCMFAEYLINYIQMPLFYIQSPYDSWSLTNILGQHCHESGSLQSCNTGQRASIEAYRSSVLQKINTNLQSNPEYGAWMPSCVNHVYEISMFNSSAFEVPMNTNHTLGQSLNAWYYHQLDPLGNKSIDTEQWPANKPCSQFQTHHKETFLN